MVRLVPARVVSEKDAAPWLLKEDVWTLVVNARVKGPGSLGPVRATKEILEAPEEISEVVAAGDRWIVASGNVLISWDGQTSANKSRPEGYGGGDWSGELFGGVPIFTNNVDPPQFQEGNSAFQDLPGWPVGWRAKSVRGYRNFLVAFGVSDAGTPLPHTIRWSHPAEPGAVPISWDIADPTKDAGEISLPDAEAGGIVEVAPLGQDLMVYKERSIWRMRFVGTPFVFELQQVVRGTGAKGRGCVAQIGPGHAVWTSDDDLVLFDGVSVRSVAAGKFREFMRGLGMPFLFPRKNGELWMFFSNEAVIWNWEFDFFSVVTLGNVKKAVRGRAGVPTAVWDEVSGVWDWASERWNMDVPAGEEFELVVRGNRLEVLEGGGVLPAVLERKFLPLPAGKGFRWLLRRVDVAGRPEPQVFVSAEHKWGDPEPFREVFWYPWAPISGEALSLRLVFSGDFEFGAVDCDVVPVGAASRR